MALQGTYTKEIEGFGIVSAPTYARINVVSATKQNGTAIVSFLSDDKTKVLDTKEYLFTPSVEEGSTNFIAQAYVELAKLPEFSGYTAC